MRLSKKKITKLLKNKKQSRKTRENTSATGSNEMTTHTLKVNKRGVNLRFKSLKQAKHVKAKQAQAKHVKAKQAQAKQAQAKQAQAKQAQAKQAQAKQAQAKQAQAKHVKKSEFIKKLEMYRKKWLNTKRKGGAPDITIDKVKKELSNIKTHEDKLTYLDSNRDEIRKEIEKTNIVVSTMANEFDDVNKDYQNHVKEEEDKIKNSEIAEEKDNIEKKLEQTKNDFRQTEDEHNNTTDDMEIKIKQLNDVLQFILKETRSEEGKKSEPIEEDEEQRNIPEPVSNPEPEENEQQQEEQEQEQEQEKEQDQSLSLEDEMNLLEKEEEEGLKTISDSLQETKNNSISMDKKIEEKKKDKEIFEKKVKQLNEEFIFKRTQIEEEKARKDIKVEDTPGISLAEELQEADKPIGTQSEAIEKSLAEELQQADQGESSTQSDDIGTQSEPIEKNEASTQSDDTEAQQRLKINLHKDLKQLEIDGLEFDLQMSQFEIDEAKRQLDENNELLQRMEEENNKIKDDQIIQEKKYQELKEEKEQLQSSNAADKEELVRKLNDEINMLSLNAIELQGNSKILDEENKRLNDLKAENDLKNEENNKKINELKEQVERKEIVIEDAANRLSKMNDERENIETLRKEKIDELINEINALKKQVLETTDKAEELLDTNEALKLTDKEKEEKSNEIIKNLQVKIQELINKPVINIVEELPTTQEIGTDPSDIRKKPPPPSKYSNDVVFDDDEEPLNVPSDVNPSDVTPNPIISNRTGTEPATPGPSGNNVTTTTQMNQIEDGMSEIIVKIKFPSNAVTNTSIQQDSVESSLKEIAVSETSVGGRKKNTRRQNMKKNNKKTKYRSKRS
jgi:hypothetical protein